MEQYWMAHLKFEYNGEMDSFETVFRKLFTTRDGVVKAVGKRIEEIRKKYSEFKITVEEQGDKITLFKNGRLFCHIELEQLEVAEEEEDSNREYHCLYTENDATIESDKILGKGEAEAWFCDSYIHNTDEPPNKDEINAFLNGRRVIVTDGGLVKEWFVAF